MTQDAQHDRSPAPLASVSDTVQPSTLPRIPEPAGEHASTAEPEASSTFDSDSFEGFGSFG